MPKMTGRTVGGFQLGGSWGPRFQRLARQEVTWDDVPSEASRTRVSQEDSQVRTTLASDSSCLMCRKFNVLCCSRLHSNLCAAWGLSQQWEVREEQDLVRP